MIRLVGLNGAEAAASLSLVSTEQYVMAVYSHHHGLALIHIHSEACGIVNEDFCFP